MRQIFQRTYFRNLEPLLHFLSKLVIVALATKEGTMKVFSFDHLTEVEFENFCYDLLWEMGFINIDWRKGTGLASSPSDRGRDIECQLRVTDIDGEVYIENWFVECKHYKQGVPIEKLQNALAWATSERPNKLLIIASNFLSNPTKDALKSYIDKQKPSFLIKIWEKPLLEKLCIKKVELLGKYRIIDTYQITDFAVAERIFISRLEAFEDMLCKVALKIGVEDVDNDLFHLDEVWIKYSQKTDWNDVEYLGYVRNVKAAGLTYSYGEGDRSIEKFYTVEDLNELSEKLIKLMLIVDSYAQSQGIRYTNLK